MKEKAKIHPLEDMVEIIPTWYESYGISILFVVVIFFISMAAIIRYPTVLKSDIDIATITPPVKVFSRVPGNYIPLVTEGSAVQLHEPLGIIDNNISYNDLQGVKIILQQTLKDSSYARLQHLNSILILEDMQDLYSQIFTSLPKLSIPDSVSLSETTSV
ncbi:hypothetical protein LVD15_26420 [Fulvivirga maritima]|uniref:hypothetical protein n=1 Tax=Fulvivirga maritima TaxID=2904247 RepID=UPI001F1B926E|nr:hypothetical protein [Fulvivirga maritima]UII26787.1 hypothetical protein LVD15_26420 [Fulvivirga maritima]